MDWSAIIRFFEASPDTEFALVSLVEKRGASFRPRGARMLVRKDGMYAGSISAGCLEEMVAEWSLEVIRSFEPRLKTIDTRPHYGCYGEITLFIEPLDSRTAKDLFERVRSALDSRTSVKITTDYRDGADCIPRTTVVEDGIRQGTKSLRGCYCESLNPRIRLLVMGAWPDAKCLAKLAAQLDWEVVPLEARAPGEGIANLPRALRPDARTAVMVMTHNLGRDVAFLAEALRLKFSYVGVVGSRRRAEELVRGIEGLEEPELLHEMDRLHSPAGLDLGTNDVNGMALSILAEIQSVFSCRDAQPLKDRLIPIHDDE